MRALPDGELDKLKASQAESMQDTCHIYRPTYSSGTYGNNVETLVPYSTGTLCSFQFMNGKMSSDGQVILIEGFWSLRLPSTIPVRIDDEIVLVKKGNTMVSGTFMPSEPPVVNEMVQYLKLRRVTT